MVGYSAVKGSALQNTNARGNLPKEWWKMEELNSKTSHNILASESAVNQMIVKDPGIVSICIRALRDSCRSVA